MIDLIPENVMLNVVGLIALLAATILVGRCGIRALRAGNAFIRYGGAALAVIVAVPLGASAALAITGLAKQHFRSAPLPRLEVEGTPEQIARGKAISDGFCSACHSKTGTLTGGLDLGEHFPIPLGVFLSANLTPAGELSGWSDGQVFRAIRNSVDARGNFMIGMSFTNAAHLSDTDIHALIAYIRALPAAGAATTAPHDRLTLLGLAMFGAGMLPKSNPVISGPITAPPKSASADYGKYILSYQDCRACHGPDLTGGTPGQVAPIGSDLRVVKGWSQDGFIKTLRTGVDPDGHELNKEMPWRPIGRMDDEELSAIYNYLLSVL
jgi:mono/diheme cytochrome c family protein